MEVTAGDVRLRDVAESDIEVFFEDQRDPEGSAMAVFASRGREDHFAHWRKIVADDTVVVRTIDIRGAVAGNVVSWLQGAERAVGYWVGRAFWGKGIASRALRLFVDELDARPLHGYVARDNVGSIRVLEKCGFRRAGERHEPGDVEELVYVLGSENGAGE